MNETNEAYLSLKQAAAKAGVAYATLRRDIENGLIPAFRAGRKYFLSAAAVDAYAENGRQTHAAEGYSIRQLMEILPLSYAFLIELIHSGRLQAKKCGRRYIISQEALDAFLAASEKGKAVAGEKD